MTTRFETLRARLGLDEDDPVIAVPAANGTEARAVRAAGGVPLSPAASHASGSAPAGDEVVSVRGGPDAVRALRAARPEAFLLDVGPARDAEGARALEQAGADGIFVGAHGYGDAGGTLAGREVAYTLAKAVPVAGGGLNAVRILGFFENLGFSSMIVIARRGVIGHRDGIAAGVESLRLAARCRRDGGKVYDFARVHAAFTGAFASFPADADALYPDWRDGLGMAR